jgi:hypothetical protein
MTMSEPLEMTLQERMLVLSFVSKSVEMLEASLPPENIANLQQWQALAAEVKPILARLDEEWPTMLPLPHDGLSWSERSG